MAISIRKAIVEGATRATSARALIVGLWLFNLLAAGALAVSMGEALHSSIGASMVQDRLRTSFDMGWFGELQGTAKGLETTFSPTVIGAGAFYGNLESWISGDLWRGLPALVTVGAVYLLVWMLLLGGIIERLARGETRMQLGAFLSNGGRYFFRFLRLGLMSGVLYLLIYLLGHRLFITIEDLTRDVTVERVVFAWTLAGTALVALLLAVINAAFDYAKIATVLEGRQSMLPAALRGFRFVLARPARTLGLYLALAVIALCLLAGYALIAPGARQSTVPGIVFAFLLGQLYLVVKLVLRLTFYGGQIALYESITWRPDR